MNHSQMVMSPVPLTPQVKPVKGFHAAGKLNFSLNDSYFNPDDQPKEGG